MHQLLVKDVSFSTMKSEAVRYLSALPKNRRSSMSFYLAAINKLQQEKLEETGKVALLKVIMRATISSDDLLPQKHSQADIAEMLEEADKTHSAWGIEVLLALPHSADLSHHHLGAVTHCLHLLNALSEDPQADEILMKFLDQEITFSQMVESLENLYPRQFDDVMHLGEDIPSLIKRFAGEDVNVSFPLPLPPIVG